MNRFSQSARALAVNDAYLQDSSFSTLGDIVRNEVLCVLRLEGVEVEDPVNWYLERPIF